MRAAPDVSAVGALTAVALAAFALSGTIPAQAQIPLIIPIPRKAAPPPEGPRAPPPDLPPAEAAIWPFPVPDPQSWWDEKRLKIPEAADPLGGRKIRRGERLPQPVNGIDPSTYRLWGLKPLQWQVLRYGEVVLELWVRPSGSVRQGVVRVTARRDGQTFVQGRAGLACCDALIGRRMGFDVELPPGSGARFRQVAEAPLWRSPRDVRVSEPGAADTVCLDGVAYDLTLAVAGRSSTVRRACDPAEVGEAADVLEAVLGAALGHDGRFDVVFPRGANFSAHRRAHAQLLASGGRLIPNPDAPRAAREQQGAPEMDVEIEPEIEPAPAPPAPFLSTAPSNPQP
ncbi:MAG: hypothetical protein U1C74_05575 [Phenylobacterium sp.]|nr:hypothetical protein [Phenylobacterium sp.]